MLSCHRLDDGVFLIGRYDFFIVSPVGAVVDNDIGGGGGGIGVGINIIFSGIFVLDLSCSLENVGSAQDFLLVVLEISRT